MAPISFDRTGPIAGALGILAASSVDFGAVLLENKLELPGQEETNVVGLFWKKSLETIAKVCF